MPERFAGKAIVVTGGSRGIGAATVARLTREGARVLVADLVEPGTLPAGARYSRVDATKGDQAAAAIAEAVRRFGRLDCLVNNAGMGALAETPDMPEETWDKVFAINVRAIFLFCKAAIPAMRQSGGGAIVNVASISGLFGDYGMDAYNASKGAVINYTRNLALNCARDRIRVNALCPGLVETEMAAAALADPEDRAHWFGLIPMGRSAKPSGHVPASLRACAATSPSELGRGRGRCGGPRNGRRRGDGDDVLTISPRMCHGVRGRARPSGVPRSTARCVVGSVVCEGVHERA